MAGALRHNRRRGRADRRAKGCRGMTAMIEVQGVSKAFGGVVANHDVSLSVPEGRITGLIGPNGSGKTTLFNSIVGYHPNEPVSIRFEGREISRLREVGRVSCGERVGEYVKRQGCDGG